MNNRQASPLERAHTSAADRAPLPELSANIKEQLRTHDEKQLFSEACVLMAESLVEIERLESVVDDLSLEHSLMRARNERLEKELVEARDKALEKAAAKCDFRAVWAKCEADDVANSPSIIEFWRISHVEAKACAAAIRALKSGESA